MRAYERLLNYVRVYTTSDPESGTHPSAEREFDLARQLVEEMKALGIEDARVDGRSMRRKIRPDWRTQVQGRCPPTVPNRHPVPEHSVL